MIEIPAIEITKDGTCENGDGGDDDGECEHNVVETPSSVGRRRSSATLPQQHQQQVRCYSPLIHKNLSTQNILFPNPNRNREETARRLDTPRISCDQEQL